MSVWGREEYQPTPEDMLWMAEMVGMLKDGGVWGCSWAVYRINKKNRVIELVAANPNVSIEHFEKMQKRTEKVFSKAGWTMKGGNDVDEEAFRTVGEGSQE